MAPDRVAALALASALVIILLLLYFNSQLSYSNLLLGSLIVGLGFGVGLVLAEGRERVVAGGYDRWVCDPSKEYGQRCGPSRERTYRSKLACESGCLRPGEKIPTIANILKFTQNLRFPIPRKFLEQIDKDPFEFGLFLDQRLFNFIRDVINKYRMERMMMEDVVKQQNIAADIYYITLPVVVRGQGYYSRLETSARAISYDDELKRQVQVFLAETYVPEERLLPLNFIPLIGVEKPWYEIRQVYTRSDTTPARYALYEVHLSLDGAHVTFLLLDRETKKGVYFDSNIIVTHSVYTWLKDKFPDYELNTPQGENCPLSLQSSAIHPEFGQDLYCQTWNIFLQHLFLLNLDKTVEERLSYMFALGPKAKEILMLYSFYIYKTYRKFIYQGIEEKNIARLELDIEETEHLRERIRARFYRESAPPFSPVTQFAIFLTSILEVSIQVTSEYLLEVHQTPQFATADDSLYWVLPRASWEVRKNIKFLRELQVAPPSSEIITEQYQKIMTQLRTIKIPEKYLDRLTSKYQELTAAIPEEHRSTSKDTASSQCVLF
jgi:hypothetical protein